MVVEEAWRYCLTCQCYDANIPLLLLWTGCEQLFLSLQLFGLQLYDVGCEDVEQILPAY